MVMTRDYCGGLTPWRKGSTACLHWDFVLKDGRRGLSRLQCQTQPCSADGEKPSAQAVVRVPSRCRRRERQWCCREGCSVPSDQPATLQAPSRHPPTLAVQDSLQPLLRYQGCAQHPKSSLLSLNMKETDYCRNIYIFLVRWLVGCFLSSYPLAFAQKLLWGSPALSSWYIYEVLTSKNIASSRP